MTLHQTPRIPASPSGVPIPHTHWLLAAGTGPQNKSHTLQIDIIKAFAETEESNEVETRDLMGAADGCLQHNHLPFEHVRA